MENNALIADFLGWESNNGKYRFTEWRDWSYDFGAQFWITPDKMLFNQSWDWLVLVINKIESEGFDVFLQPMEFTIIRTEDGYDFININHGGKCMDIDPIYNGVVDFIKDYFEMVKC